MTSAQINQLATQILDAAFVVHRELGPGLLEGTYHACLTYELRKRGHNVRSEVPIPVNYDGQRMTDVGYRIDLLVDELIILELKAQETISPVHRAQLLSYLRHSNKRLGLILNFHAPLLKDGIVRIANSL